MSQDYWRLQTLRLNWLYLASREGQEPLGTRVDYQVWMRNIPTGLFVYVFSPCLRWWFLVRLHCLGAMWYLRDTEPSKRKQISGDRCVWLSPSSCPVSAFWAAHIWAGSLLLLLAQPEISGSCDHTFPAMMVCTHKTWVKITFPPSVTSVGTSSEQWKKQLVQSPKSHLSTAVKGRNRLGP